MRQLIFLFALGTSLFSCTSTGNNKENNKVAANLDIADKYMKAVETNNAAVMDSLLADNYIGYGPSVGDSVNKADALASWKYTAENLYESMKYTRHQNIAVTVKEGEEAEAGDWVSNSAYLTIKYKDGRGPVNAWVNAFYKIENDSFKNTRKFLSILTDHIQLTTIKSESHIKFKPKLLNEFQSLVIQNFINCNHVKKIFPQ